MRIWWLLAISVVQSGFGNGVNSRESLKNGDSENAADASDVLSTGDGKGEIHENPIRQGIQSTKTSGSDRLDKNVCLGCKDEVGKEVNFGKESKEKIQEKLPKWRIKRQAPPVEEARNTQSNFDSDNAGWDANISADKRARMTLPFYWFSWQNPEKKAKLYDWNRKRTKFSSWAGKRSGNIMDIPSSAELKTSKFSSWAGKRSDNEFSPILEDLSKWTTNGENDNNFQSGEKRAKFSSWSGKRSVEPDLDYEKRAKFSSWSGKRSYEPDLDYDKRAKFSSWSGKRSYEPDLDYDKRAKFSSWSGKRSYEPDLDYEKRAKFSSWSGKRSVEPDLDYEKRAKFSSWSGKRSYESDLDYDKRGKFSSWSGKRSYEPDLDYEKRAKFSSWSGKRAYEPDLDYDKRGKFSSWSGKRAYDPVVENEKRAFSSWSGKRSFDENDDYDKRAFSSWSGKRAYEPDLDYDKRAKFSSWSGKRDTDIPSYNGFDADPYESEQKRGRKFSSWGGKRSIDENALSSVEKKFAEYRNPDTVLPRMHRFNSWRGKRRQENRTSVDIIYGETDENGKSEGVATNKTKREVVEITKVYSPQKIAPRYNAADLIVRRYPEIQMQTWKRKQGFSSWSGKRNDAQARSPAMNDDQDEYSTIPKLYNPNLIENIDSEDGDDYTTRQLKKRSTLQEDSSTIAMKSKSTNPTTKDYTAGIRINSTELYKSSSPSRKMTSTHRNLNRPYYQSGMQATPSLKKINKLM